MYKVSSVIVLFNPDQDVLENIKSISDQSEFTAVVDNGSSNIDDFRQSIDNMGVELICLEQNYGIAHALNIGILACPQSSDWIATFDQDTKIEPDYFSLLLSQGREIKDSSIAMLCPGFSGVKESIPYQIGPVRKILTAISSGSMIKREILSAVGLMDDELFIDYVDNDFCLRVNQIGLSIYEITGVKLNHSLGRMSPHYIFGTKIHTSNHSPIRRYYVFRNRIYIYKIYGRKFFTWCARDFLRNFTEIAKIILFEGDKRLKIRMVFEGIGDGLKGKMGKFERPSMYD